MLGYIVLFLSVSIPATAAVFVWIREKEKKNKKQRAPRIDTHSRANNELHKLRYTEMTIEEGNLIAGSLLCAILRWSEKHHDTINTHDDLIKQLYVQMKRVDELERLVKKMSVIALNQQEKE